METLKKCVVSRYDETITEPPYKTIPIDTFEVHQPDVDDGGVEFYIRLFNECEKKNYKFKFYSLSSDKKFDYNVVVY